MLVSRTLNHGAGPELLYIYYMTPKQNDPQQRIHLVTKKPLQFVYFLNRGQKTITICIFFESGTKTTLQFVSFLSRGQNNYYNLCHF